MFLLGLLSLCLLCIGCIYACWPDACIPIYPHQYQSVWTHQMLSRHRSKHQPWLPSKWWKTRGENQHSRLHRSTHHCYQALRHFSADNWSGMIKHKFAPVYQGYDLVNIYSRLSCSIYTDSIWIAIALSRLLGYSLSLWSPVITLGLEGFSRFRTNLSNSNVFWWFTLESDKYRCWCCF